MICYVVVSQMMNSKDAVGLYLGKEDAAKFMNGPFVSMGCIIEYETNFDFKFEDELYVSHNFDESHEVQHFEGLYLDKEKAKKNINEKGIVLKLDIQ
ncbi:MAG: hypothetical protein COA79_13075 [Planctomycetota bacterium]|nr:MAG: hypothetical protein COA79_13075 [Planctomycetota bacterium]